MRFIAAFIISAAIIAGGAVAFAYSGFYDVAATSPHSGPVAWLLSTTSDASVERHARNVEVPVLTGEDRLAAGAGDYDEMCAGCHGAPGRKAGPLGKGLNPDPPDLEHAADELSAAELFWVTKHGIRMTGMPSWGVTHDDDDLWSIVAFVGELPRMDAARYQTLVAEAHARHLGHHGGEATDEADGHSETDHDQGTPSQDEPADDHSD